MKISIEWFKSKKKEELEQLKVEEQKLKNDLLKAKLKKVSQPEEEYIIGADPYRYRTTSTSDMLSHEIVKPYMSVKLVNDVLIVVLPDGAVITKTGATVDDYNKVTASKTLDDITKVVTVPQVIAEKEKNQKEVDRMLNIRKGLEMMDGLSDFEMKNDAIYLRNTDRSIPELLVNRFLDILDPYFDQYSIQQIEELLVENEQYQALKKFWLKCCLNPSAQSAEDLYTFLSHHQFKIDKHGNFYTYRRVVSRNDAADKQLVDFISNSYSKIKAVWKKKPSDFRVMEEDDTYHFEKVTNQSPSGKIIGNLEALYLDLPNMKGNSYTSAHTGQENYRVGEVVAMPRHEGDDNNTISCSKGSK